MSSVFDFIRIRNYYKFNSTFKEFELLMKAMDTESSIEHGVVQHHAVAMALQMPEILEKIFGYLVKLIPKDLINSALVCRKWRDAAYHPTLWRRRKPCLYLKPSDTVQLLPSLAKRQIQRIHLLDVQAHMRDLLPSLPLLKNFYFGSKHTNHISSGCIMTDTMLCEALQQRHTALTSFILYDCKEVTDARVIPMSTRLPNLERLGLTMCPQVTDAGFVAAVCGLPRLYFLWASMCAITDAGVTELALRRPEVAPGTLQMRQLNLSGNGITDTALLYISTIFPKLELLVVMDCVQLTDSGLDHLGNMDALKCIYVERSTGVTKNGLNQLQLRLKIKLEYEPARYPW